LAGALIEPAAANASLLHVMRLFQIVVMTNYYVLPGGIASLAETLAARLAVRYRTPASRLVVEQGAVTGVAFANGAVETADHVILAVPPAAALAMLPEDWRAERAYLGGIVQPPFTLVSFFMDRPLDPKVWSYMAPAGGLISFFTDAARKAPAMAPSGRGILQAWSCYPASQTLASLGDTEIIARCRAELDRFFPRASGWIEEAYVTRHPHAVPLHTVGHQRRTLDFLRSADERRGVSFCGDYMTGGFMEAALWSAERAAARIG
jgi:protoporphyrinogen oxidase